MSEYKLNYMPKNVSTVQTNVQIYRTLHYAEHISTQ